MRLCFTHMYLVLLSYKCVSANRRVLVFVNSILLFNFLGFFKHRHILKSQQVINDEYYVFFRQIVNYFTNFCWLTRTGYNPHQINAISSSRGMPDCTICRIHVMPWTTQFWRIGRIRLKYNTQETRHEMSMIPVMSAIKAWLWR